MSDFESDGLWRRSGSPTLKDVARRVGVSESAASVVLNGARSHTRVSAKTRERVTKAAQELGYRPNAVARALFSGRTNRIGVYASKPIEADDPFWSGVLVGLYRGAKALDIDIVIHTSSGQQNRLMQMVSDRTVDGLIVISQGDAHIISLLEERHVPAVAIVDRIEGLPSVCVDDRGGGVMLARHLKERGHRTVLALESAAIASAATMDRLRGLVEGSGALGFEVRRSEFAWDSERPLRDGELGLLGSNGATAVVAHNDVVAGRVVRQLMEAGVSVPAEVAVAGFDGFSPYFVPAMPLTSIFADWAEVAAAGVNVLMSLVNRQPVRGLTTLPVSFKQGATT